MSNGRARKLLGEAAQTKFKRFEVLVVATGSTAIIASAILSYLNNRSLLEFTGQLLLLPVLLVALQYGRIGATISAGFATVIYLVARMPEMGDTVLIGTVLQLIGVRAVSYFIVGLVGGEAMTAIKYYFAKSGGLGGIDSASGVYVADFIKGMIEKEINNYERYSSDFSVVTLELSPDVLRMSGKFKTDKTCKGLGSLLKNDLRVVDEVGRLDDFYFAMLLPHTPAAGAQAVANRVADSVADYYGVSLSAGIYTKVYSVPRNLSELKALVGLPETQRPIAMPKPLNQTKA